MGPPASTWASVSLPVEQKPHSLVGSSEPVSQAFPEQVVQAGLWGEQEGHTLALASGLAGWGGSGHDLCSDRGGVSPEQPQPGHNFNTQDLRDI